MMRPLPVQTYSPNTQLVPFKRRLFNFKRISPSRASQGLCSRCFRWASFALMTQGRPRWALCKLHAQLYRLNRQRSDVRVLIYSLDADSVESNLIELNA